MHLCDTLGSLIAGNEEDTTRRGIELLGLTQQCCRHTRGESVDWQHLSTLLTNNFMRSMRRREGNI